MYIKTKNQALKDNSVTVHIKNLQYLATEIFKVKSGLSPIIINEVFNFQENEGCNLRSGIHLPSRNMHTAHFRTDTISSLGPKLWKLITDKIKHASTLSALLRILVLLKFVRITSGIHINAYSACSYTVLFVVCF